MKASAVGSLLGRYGAAVSVVFLGSVLSVLLFHIVQIQEQARAQAVFERQANSYVAAIQKGIEGKLEVIESIGVLYAASNKVGRDRFREFTQGDLSYHNDIQALEWIPRVTDSDRTSYEEGARDWLAGFQFTERQTQGRMIRAQQRAEYYPVYFVEPLTGNEVAVGFDLGSNPTRLRALELARDIEEEVATGRITLAQETGEQYGFLIFRAIYRNGAPHETPQDRRESLMGYVLGVFRVGDLVEASVKTLPEEIFNIQLVDEGSAAGERLLYLRRASPGDGPADEEELEVRDSLFLRASLEMPGRQWSLLISPTPEFLDAQASWVSWGVLAGGLLITALLLAYLVSMIKHAAKIERLAADLEVSEEQYRDLYMNAPVSYFAVGIDGLIKRCNKAAEELIGSPAKDLVGKPVTDLYSDSSQGKEKAKAAFQRFASGQNVSDEELEMQRVDGTSVWVSLMVDVVRGPGGEIIESRSMAVDITERKLAVEQLTYQAHLLDNVSDAVISADENFVKTTWNRAAEEMYGWTAEEIIGRPSEQLLQPEFVDLEPGEVIRRLLEDGRFEGEVIHPRKDGTRIITEARAIALRDKDGDLTGFVSIDRDITERKRAEVENRRLALAVANASDGVIVTGMDGRISFVNRAAVKMYGYAPGEMLGMNFFDLHPESFRETTAREIFVATMNEGSWTGEVPLLNKSGEELLVRLSTAIMKDDVGHALGIVGTATDVTERRQLQEQLVQAQKMEAIGRLAGGVAHDFNNLLTVIIGYSHLGQTGLQTGGGPARANFQKIQKAAERASELTKSCWPSPATRSSNRRSSVSVNSFSTWMGCCAASLVKISSL